jgi:peptidoglycan/LPS O-acetylase OafA/YrhL
MSATARAPRQSRLAWLDALRGFAALCVVFDHGSTLLLLPVRSFLYQWFNLGQYGVFVFFLVSGYIVPASLERKGSVRGFWISRAFRLYPMFLAGLLLSAVAYKTGHGTIANAGAHRLTAVLGWLFMLQNLNAGLNVPVVTWTLSYEMVFYLLLAGLFSWGVHRRSGWYATAFAVGAVALGGVLPMSALGHWSSGPGAGPLVLNAVTDVLILAGLVFAMSSRSRLVKYGTSLAALVAMVLLTFNQSYPYPWEGCTILALMFAGTLIYRAEQYYLSYPRGGDRSTPRGGTTPLHPPVMGGCAPPIPPAAGTAPRPRRPRTVAEAKSWWLPSAGAAKTAAPGPRGVVAGAKSWWLLSAGAARTAAPGPRGVVAEAKSWWCGVQRRHAPLLSAVVVVLVLVLVTWAGVWHGARHGHHWQLQWATSVLLAGATFGIGLAVRRWRVPRWCAWLGMISYSVYLLHPLVFNAYRSIPALHRPHAMWGQVLFFAGLLAVIIGLSALTYYLIEMPMQRLGHRVAARFPNTTGTPSGDGSSALDDGAADAASRSASSSTAVAGGSGGSP